jgi:hypothetical protein
MRLDGGDDRVLARGHVCAAAIAFAMLVAAVCGAQLVDADDRAARDDTAGVAATASGDLASDGQKTVSYPAVTAVPVGHHGEYDVQYEDLPPETQAQLDVVRQIIERYPTAADAVADGWTAATINLEGIAAHFIRGGAAGFARFDTTFELTEPEALLYDGIEPDAPIVGVSYLLSGETPDGFEGTWDVWHRHDAVCFARGLVIAEVGGHPDSRIAMSENDCRAQGGAMFPIANLSMIHVWMKPGFLSATGVFAHDHSAL